MVDDALQKSLKMSEHALDCGGVEKVCAIGEITCQCRACLPNIQRQIESCRPALNVYRLNGQTRQFDGFVRRVLKREHRLNDGHMAQISLRLKLFNQFIEGELLMCIRAECSLFDLCEQLAKTQVVAEVCAHDECVNEETD